MVATGVGRVCAQSLKGSAPQLISDAASLGLNQSHLVRLGTDRGSSRRFRLRTVSVRAGGAYCPAGHTEPGGAVPRTAVATRVSACFGGSGVGYPGARVAVAWLE